MTNQQKLDFKAILTSLVYGGDVTQIPEDDVNDVINQPDSESVDEGSGGVLSFVFTILKYIAYLLIIFLVLVAGYYLVYFLFFRKNGSSFTDFVNKTTKRESPETAANSQEENFDVFADMDTQSSNTSPEKVDPLAQASVVPKEEKPSTPGDEVPDWLKGSFEKTQTPVTKSEPIASEVQETERVKEQEAPASSQEIPDWLKGSDTLGEQAEVSPLQDTLETQEVVSKEQQVEEKEELVSEIPKEDLETLTQIDTSSSVPDWLKGSIDESETPKAKVDLPEAEDFSENMTEVVAPDTSDSLSKEANITEEASASSENDFNLPDWLKADESEDTTLTQEEIVPNPLSDTAPKAEKKGAEKSPDTSAGSKKKNKTSENKKSSEVQNKVSGAEKKNSKTKKTDEELWDDGMKIPDWLKSESDS